MTVAIGLKTAGHGQEAPGVRAGVRERIWAVEVGIGERPLGRGEGEMVAAATASAYDDENYGGGNKDGETIACPHGFYLARIERIMTSKCVPEAVAARPSNKGVTLKQPASCVYQLRNPGGLPLTLVSAHSGLLRFLGYVARCDARAAASDIALRVKFC